jgi:CSLREA domain-containing protein
MKFKRWSMLMFVVCLAAAFGRGPAKAQTATSIAQPLAATTAITVTTTDDELNTDGDCSLREAIQAANCDCAVDACPAGSGKDTITLEDNGVTYLLDLVGAGEDDNQTGDLDIHSEVRIHSYITSNTIDGNATDRVFHVHAGASLELENLTVTNGRVAGEEGGGIYNGWGHVALDYVYIENNVSAGPFPGGYGGGIYNYLGTLSIANSYILDNATEALASSCNAGGGGIVNALGTTTIQATNITGNSTHNDCLSGVGGGLQNMGGSMTIVHSMINENDADWGGGIRNSGDLYLESSIIDNNDATAMGGGIHTGYADTLLTVVDSTLSNNTSDQDGGGLWVQDGEARLTNSTLSGNWATTDGGGIYVTAPFYPTHLYLTHVTMIDNGAGSAGGGLLTNMNAYLETSFDNALIALNYNGDCAGTGTPLDQGHNFVGDGSCGFPVGGDPLVGPLQDNGGPLISPFGGHLRNPVETHALLPGSPAIDTGDCAGDTVLADQRGVERPQDGDGVGGAACDIGAYERRATRPVLFDEAHDEWKTLDAGRADALCPDEIPWCADGDEDYVLFTQLQSYLSDEFTLVRNADQPLTLDLLSQYDALMITVNQQPLTAAEETAVQQYVAQGGGLIWIGDCGYWNPNPDLEAAFSLEFVPQCLFTLPYTGDLEGDIGDIDYTNHEASRFSTDLTLNWGATVDPLDTHVTYWVAYTGTDVWEDTNGSDAYEPGEDRAGEEFSVAVAYEDSCGRVVALSDDAYSNDFLGWTDNEVYMRSLLRWVTDGTACETPCRATGWTPTIATDYTPGQGLGDPDNWAVLSLAEHDGHLLAGTGNDTGAQVRRWSGGYWYPYLDFGDIQDTVTGIDHISTFADRTCLATWDETAGGGIWCSWPGAPDVWGNIVDDGFGDEGNTEVFRLGEFRGELYAGTWKYDGSGAEVWRSADGVIWEQVNADGFGDTGNESVLTFAIRGDYLYAGTYNPMTGGELWRSLDGTVWDQVNQDGFGTAANRGVSGLAVFHDHLYAITTGTAPDQGAQVWRCYHCGVLADWEVVVNDGFGDGENAGMSGLEVFQGALYAVVGNNTTGLQVWRTTNGTDWQRSGSPGFGQADNARSYWDNALTVYNDLLWVGTLNPTSGGEVWQSECMPYGVYVPLVCRDSGP